ncbi:MAG TPA: hypothetical protein VKT32_13145, partial [Chthonomonadaceae bacterium]|nr:hypothetical protein [Chthonomonadaceae bacterium]
YNGLLYFSHSQRSANLLANLLPSSLDAKPAPQTDPGSDHLIVQDLNLHSGVWQAHASYQDVGKQFGGFSALKLSNAGNKAMLDELAQLEGEKGVKRIGFGFAYQPSTAATPVGSVPNGFAFDWSQIKDGKGAITQQSVGYHASAFHFDYAALDISQAFTQFNGLREADHAQWAKEKGLRSRSLDLGLNFGRGGQAGSLDFTDARLEDTTKTGARDAGMRRESLALNTPALDLIYVRRQTGAGFSRLGDLADLEKSSLALDILRQFDPTATLKEVTQKERDQAATETGLERDFLGGAWRLGKAGALAFEDTHLYDTAAKPDPKSERNAIRRQMLSFTGRSLQFSWMQQSISDGFSRLTSLSDVERAQFGNEHGLERQQWQVAWQPNKTTKLSFSSLSAGSTPEAAAAALAAARQNGQDLQAAARVATARLQREAFTFETKGLSLAAHFADTGKGFTRAADLALPAADQSSITSEQGYRRNDYTLHFAMLKGLTVDSTTYNAQDALDKLRHDTYKQSLQYVSGRGLQLVYSADGDVATTDNKANGLTHSHLALGQTFGKGMQLALSQDDSTTYTNGAVSQALHTQDAHFQSDQKQPNALLFDDQRITYQDGKFQNTVNVNVHAKPAREFAFDYTKQQIDSDVPNDPSANTDTLDFTWDANKQLAMTGSVSEHESADKRNSDTVSLGLKGQPCKDVAVDARWNEVHQDAKDTKDVADVALSNPKPFRLGPIQELTLSARYASLNDQRKLQNETVTGRASWKLWKNEFLLDYGGLTQQNRQSSITRTYSFLTDPNPKKWFHAGFLYKDRSLYTGEEQLIRRFTADARLSKTLQFSYLFGTLPEDEKGNITPETTANVSLKDSFLAGLSGEVFYRSQNNTATKILTRSLGLGFEGKISRLASLRFAYSLDANGTATTYDHSDHFLLGFRQQINADHLLDFSIEYRTHDSLGLTRQITTNLDFRTVF